MRLLKMMVGMGLAVFAMMAITPARVDAAQLVYFHIVGGTTTTYTLDVEEGACGSTCEVKLTIDFSNPSAFDGKFLDSVQFKVDGVSPVSTPTLVDTNAGATGDWDVLLANLNSNQCGGGSTSSTCAQYNVVTPDGGFQVNAGDSIFFTFNVDWAEDLVLGDNLISGVVRAAYNNAGGKNFAIFSPGSGNFGGEGGGEGGGGIVVPEPASISLFGLGLFGAAYRARRRRIG